MMGIVVQRSTQEKMGKMFEFLCSLKPYLKASSSVIVPSNILGVDAGVNASKDDSTVWQASSTLRPRVGGFIMYLTDGKGMSGNCNRLTGKGSSLKFLIFDNSCGVLCWVSNFLSLSTSGSSVYHEMRNEVMRWKIQIGKTLVLFYPASDNTLSAKSVW